MLPATLGPGGVLTGFPVPRHIRFPPVSVTGRGMGSLITSQDEENAALLPQVRFVMRHSAVQRSVALGILAGVVGAAHADFYEFRVIAKTGDTAPGTTGSFTEFATPLLNGFGQIAFQAENNAIVGNSGLWSTIAGTSNQLEAIAIQDMAAPGLANGVKFASFSDVQQHPLINDDGDVGFSAKLSGLAPGTVTGLFRRLDGVVSKVAIPGDQAPGMAPGVTFDWLSSGPSFNENGLMAFASRLTGPGINATNDNAIYMHWFGGLNQVMREGGAAPGLAGTTFGLFSGGSYPTIDNTGKIAMASDLFGAQASDWSVWTGYPGAMEMVAKTGDLAPSGMAYESTFNGFWGARQGANGLNFPQSVDNGGSSQSGYYYYDGNTVEEVVREGALGPLGFYGNFSTQVGWVNATGASVFASGFSFFGLSADEDSAMILKRPGEVAEVIAREGDQPYGLGPGVEFDDMRSGFVILNDNERVLFRGFARGPGINDDNDMGLWAYDANGAKHLVIRQGQWIDLGGGNMKQVTGFSFRLSSSMHAGRRAGMNNRGDVALRVYFADNSQAVVVAQLPPPCNADLNHDGWINVLDLLILLEEWGPADYIGEGGDINWDGVADVQDLLEMLTQWGPCV